MQQRGAAVLRVVERRRLVKDCDQPLRLLLTIFCPRIHGLDIAKVFEIAKRFEAAMLLLLRVHRIS